MKRHQLLFLIISLLALTCKKEPPPAVHIPTLALTAVDASCTEAWLKLTTTQLPATVRLMRLTPTLQTLQTLQLTTPDTLLIDEGLLPRRTYTYKAYRLEVRGSGFEVVDSSTQATVSTMDTTSHNFTWQLDTLGTHSSVLYDVAIINDTLVYAVGEIFHRDSSENWTFFNLAKWNGRQWTLHRIRDAQNNMVPGNWILAFSANDIWVSEHAHWDGAAWRFLFVGDPVFAGVRTTKAWGTSSSDFYVVGNGGFIAHYDGVRWRRIESGTNVDFVDIWGERFDGASEIVAVASYGIQVPQARAVVKIEPSAVSAVRDDGLPLDITSVWFMPRRKYFIGGAGFYQTRRLGQSWIQDTTEIVYHVSRISARGWNDIVTSGSFGRLSHFNGWSWRHYAGVELPYIHGAIGARMGKHLIIAVGWLVQGKAIAVRGWRQ
jgi:hypothetical protein